MTKRLDPSKRYVRGHEYLYGKSGFRYTNGISQADVVRDKHADDCKKCADIKKRDDKRKEDYLIALGERVVNSGEGPSMLTMPKEIALNKRLNPSKWCVKGHEYIYTDTSIIYNDGVPVQVLRAKMVDTFDVPVPANVKHANDCEKCYKRR